MKDTKIVLSVENNREQKAEYRADMKKQYETYGNYDPNRNNKPKNNNKPCKERVVNEKFNCELCNKLISTNTKDKHVDSSICKRRKIYLDIWNSLVHTTLWTKNILLMVILILMVLLN